MRRVVEANNYYRSNRAIDPAVLDKMTIVYSDPSIVTDEKADLEVEQTKWSAGLSSPVAYLQSKHPNMTAQEAEQQIRDNLDLYNELMGLKVQMIPPNEGAGGGEQKLPETKEGDNDN